MSNGLLEALVTIVESGEKIEPLGTLPGLLDSMPRDLKMYCQALLNNEPPIFLSLDHWNLGLLDEDSARALVADAGGNAEVAAHRHLVGIAMEGGGLPAVAGFSPDKFGEKIYVCDIEYQRVEEVGLNLRLWLRDRFLGGAGEELRRAIQEVMGHPVLDVEFNFEPIEQGSWQALDQLPDEATDKLLRAGQHMYFRTSETGDVVVAIHNKGVRFVGTNGKRKAKGVKGFKVDTGSISEDGSYALLLNHFRNEDVPRESFYRFTRVTLPEGKVTEIEAARGYWTSYAHLRDDHILKAHEGEIVLYKVTDDGLVERQRLGTVDLLDSFPKVFSFYHGRLFVVVSYRIFFVGAFKDGELRWLGKGNGDITKVRVRDAELYLMKEFRPVLLTGWQELYDKA